MNFIMKLLWIILASILVIGLAFIMIWGIPAPQAEITKEIPNDRFFSVQNH